MPKLKSQSMILCSSGEPLHLSYSQPRQLEHEKRERPRYGPRFTITHGQAEHRQHTYRQAFSRLSQEDRAFLKQARIEVVEQPTTEEIFRQLAREWSSEVRAVSSLTAMASHPKYRQIVKLGWSVVPLLIADMKQNKRFWTPALREITGIQPFDPSDAGNSKIVIEAWVNWGKNKYKQANKCSD